MRSFIDQLIGIADNALRTVTANPKEKLPIEEFPSASHLPKEDQDKAAALMRVNHCGEVCAQALYDGQRLTTRSEPIRQHLAEAANEERKHLQICETRLKELDADTSILDPVFYATSFTMGAVAGLLDPRVGLGFVEATEDEVCKHLDKHLSELSEEDSRTRSMLESIRSDEAKHQTSAAELGGVVFGQPLKRGMGLLAKVMTKTTRVI